MTQQTRRSKSGLLKVTAVVAPVQFRAFQPITRHGPAAKKGAISIPDFPDVWAETTIDRWRVAYRLGTPDAGKTVAIVEIRVFPDVKYWTTSKQTVPPGQWAGEVLGFYASGPEEGITARLLRRIPIGRHTAAIRQYDADALYFALDAGALTKLRKSPARKRRRGPKALPKAFYVRLADRYKALCRSGSPSPCQTIARERGWEGTRVRSAIRRCRDRGLVG